MKVSEIMTPNPVTCSSSDNLNTAAMRMWDRDCGILPVVDDGRVQGVITDRDICMALAFKGAKPAGVTVAEVINGQVYGCSPDDDVADALATMREHQVHRLPVLEDGRLQGLLSMNDAVLAAREPTGDEQGPTYSEVVDTLHGICEHRHLAAVS